LARGPLISSSYVCSAGRALYLSLIDRRWRSIMAVALFHAHHCSRSVCVLFLCLASRAAPRCIAAGRRGGHSSAGFFFPATKMVACISLSSWKLCARPCMHAWASQRRMATTQHMRHCHVRVLNRRRVAMAHGPCMPLDRPIAMHACIATAYR
jgi:hypothetical protein